MRNIYFKLNKGQPAHSIIVVCRCIVRSVATRLVRVLVYVQHVYLRKFNAVNMVKLSRKSMFRYRSEYRI